MQLHSFIHKGLITGILAFPFTLISAPILSIDSADYDLGAVYQNENKSVNHTFQIKNTGDSALIITDVRASCGCTTVGNDTLIQPGKTGKVSEIISTQNMHSGAFRKYVTIRSNAKNKPEIKVSLGGTLKSYIELSKEEIRLVSTDQKIWSDSLILSTEKKDLAISELTFKPYNDGGQNTPTWQSDLKLYPKYTFSKSDSTSGKFVTYSIKIFFVAKDSEPKFGQFTMKTNHPKMPEIQVSGAIEGRK
jgi:hypothetical protein